MASRSHRGRRAAAAPATPWSARALALADTRVARALVAHQHLTAAALLALLVLVCLWPALVMGHVLAPTALLQLEVPWAAGAPSGVARYANGDLADVPITYYPWNVLARAFIHAGTFPAWNPHAFAGTPLFANLEMAWASPFSLPLWLLPLNYGLGVAAALKLWAAGFGTYLLARELRLGFWPGIVAGAAFALCAFNVIWLSHSVFVSVAALLPWTIWLTERIVLRRRGADGLALTLVVALALAGGHPGTQVHILGATALYALVRTLALERSPTRARLAGLGLVAAAMVVGALLTAVLLLPGERAAADTVGAVARANGSPSFVSSSLSLDTLRTTLFPDWWGRPSEHVSLGPANYRERTFYAGAVALVLALIALVAPGGWRRKGPFVLLGALGVAIALRTPVLWDLVIHLPLFDRIQNGRILLLFTFAVPVLAAFGLQALLDRAVAGRRVAAVLGAALLAGVVAAGSQLDGGAIGAAVRHMVSRSDETAPDALALASAGWWLVLVLAVAAAYALMRRRPDRRLAVAAALAAVVALDMLHFAHGFQPIGPASQVVPPRTPAIAYLQRNEGAGRIAGISVRPEDWTLPADWSTVYGLHDVRGNDAPFPTHRYFRLWRIMDPTSITPYQLSTLTRETPQVLGLLGGRFVVVPPGAELPASRHLRSAYRGPDADILVNELAMPRAIVAGDVTVAGDEDDEVAAIAGAGFDPRTDAVVRRDELASAAAPAGAAGTVRVVDERNSEVTLRARLERPGLVVLGDHWAPGWSVEVDGRPETALQANLVLRGVVVPRGTHEVVWRYSVPGLRTGAWLTAVGLAATLAWAGALIVRRRRRRVAATP